MSPGEIAVAVSVTTAGALTAAGFGALAWTGRRLVSKVDAVDRAVRGDGAGAPGLGEQIRGVGVEVGHVRRELREHVAGEPARIEDAIFQHLRDEE